MLGVHWLGGEGMTHLIHIVTEVLDFGQILEVIGRSDVSQKERIHVHCLAVPINRERDFAFLVCLRHLGFETYVRCFEVIQVYSDNAYGKL